MKKTLLLGSALAVALTACAEPSEPAATDPTGTAWVLKSGVVADAPIPVLDTHPISLVFDEHRAGGTSACNQYSGPYSISGNEMSFGDMTQTMMACTPDQVMESEAMYLEALAKVSTFTATDDSLTLSGGGAELTFLVDESAT